ncbi:hypothetical protein P7C73_g2114, partial [Tremellales sp. Uapishka_1]
MSSAREHFVHGVKCYGENQYHEATKAFDKAILLDGKKMIYLDSKAAAMAKIPEWRRHAYEVARDMCVLFKDDHKAWHRKVQIYQTIARADPERYMDSKRFNGALNTLEKALALAPPDKKRHYIRYREQLQAEQKQAFEEKKTKEKQRVLEDERKRVEMETRKIAYEKSKINYVDMLSADVIRCIAEMGRVWQPDIVLRMSHVNQMWRGVMLDQPSMWSNLVIGKKRPISTAQIWKERSKGRILEITLDESFPRDKAPRIEEILADCLGEVRTLINLSDFDPSAGLWKGKLANLERIRILRPRNGYGSDFNVTNSMGLLDLRGDKLKHLDIEDVSRPSVCQVLAPELLSSLISVRLLDLIVLRPVGEKDDWRATLLKRLPNAVDIELKRVRLTPVDDRPLCMSPNVRLDRLRSYTETGMTGAVLLFDRLKVPNLTSLNLWSHGSLPPPFGILNQILAPGLEMALPNLISLDIGKSALDQTSLIGVLDRLPKLRFLNVSYCTLDNRFLEILVEKKGLLNDLTALSIAGNDTITGGPLGRLIRSRLVRKDLRADDTLDATEKKHVPRTELVRKSSFLPSIRPTSSSQAKIIEMEKENTKEKAKQEAKAPITWLNVDSCNNLEPEIVNWIKRNVRAVSAKLGEAMNENRVRGKGAYRWDAEWRDECGIGAESLCQMRRIPNGMWVWAGTGGFAADKRSGADPNGGWMVYHRCEKKSGLGDGTSGLGWMLSTDLEKEV